MNSFLINSYNPINELMNYYHYNFIPYYILVFIIVINNIKLIRKYIIIKKGLNSHVKLNFSDLIINMLVIIALFNGAIFHGVLSDIALNQSKLWITQMFIVFILAVILCLIHFIFIVLISINTKKHINNNKI